MELHGQLDPITPETEEVWDALGSVKGQEPHQGCGCPNSSCWSLAGTSVFPPSPVSCWQPCGVETGRWPMTQGHVEGVWVNCSFMLPRTVAWAGLLVLATGSGGQTAGKDWSSHH